MDAMVESVSEELDDEMESELSKQVGVHRSHCHCRVLACSDIMGGGVICVGVESGIIIVARGLGGVAGIMEVVVCGRSWVFGVRVGR